MTTTTTPLLVGITGLKGSGKSTLAAMLAELIPDARIVAFADDLKKRVHQIVEGTAGIVVTPGQIDAHKGDVFGPLYQGWGQLVREFVHEDYWIHRLEERLPMRAIVADVRYVNEAAWIHRRGGLLISLVGPERREHDARSVTHPSETGVLDCRKVADIQVENTGTLSDLHRHAVMAARIATSLSETPLCAS